MCSNYTLAEDETALNRKGYYKITNGKALYQGGRKCKKADCEVKTCEDGTLCYVRKKIFCPRYPPCKARKGCIELPVITVSITFSHSSLSSK